MGQWNFLKHQIVVGNLKSWPDKIANKPGDEGHPNFATKLFLNQFWRDRQFSLQSVNNPQHATSVVLAETYCVNSPPSTIEKCQKYALFWEWCLSLELQQSGTNSSLAISLSQQWWGFCVGAVIGQKREQFGEIEVAAAPHQENGHKQTSQFLSRFGNLTTILISLCLLLFHLSQICEESESGNRR